MPDRVKLRARRPPTCQPTAPSCFVLSYLFKYSFLLLPDGKIIFLRAKKITCLILNMRHCRRSLRK